MLRFKFALQLPGGQTNQIMQKFNKFTVQVKKFDTFSLTMFQTWLSTSQIKALMC